MDIIGLVDLSTTLPKDETIALIAAACEAQLSEQVAEAWGRISPQVVVYANKSLVPDDVPVVYFFDTADQAGALGYHDETPEGIEYARVFAKTCRDNGATWIDGINSISGTTSHEVIELFLDEHVNMWFDDFAGKLWIGEGCDWVENDDGNTIAIIDSMGTTRNVGVSNFLYPSAFDAHAKAGSQLDYLKTLSKQFSITPGGYATYLVADTSNAQQIYGRIVKTEWGSEYPEWKKETKNARGGRTLKKVRRLLGNRNFQLETK